MTERKVQGGEAKGVEDALVDSDGRGESFRQPNRGVNPSRQERIQHIDTAIHERLCVARALYLRAMEGRDEREELTSHMKHPFGHSI